MTNRRSVCAPFVELKGSGKRSLPLELPFFSTQRTTFYGAPAFFESFGRTSSTFLLAAVFFVHAVAEIQLNFDRAN